MSHIGSVRNWDSQRFDLSVQPPGGRLEAFFAGLGPIDTDGDTLEDHLHHAVDVVQFWLRAMTGEKQVALEDSPLVFYGESAESRRAWAEELLGAMREVVEAKAGGLQDRKKKVISPAEVSSQAECYKQSMQRHALYLRYIYHCDVEDGRCYSTDARILPGDDEDEEQIERLQSGRDLWSLQVAPEWLCFGVDWRGPDVIMSGRVTWDEGDYSRPFATVSPMGLSEYWSAIRGGFTRSFPGCCQLFELRPLPRFQRTPGDRNVSIRNSSQ